MPLYQTGVFTIFNIYVYASIQCLTLSSYIPEKNFRLITKSFTASLKGVCTYVHDRYMSCAEIVFVSVCVRRVCECETSCHLHCV